MRIKLLVRVNQLFILCSHICKSVGFGLADLDSEGLNAPSGRGFWGRMFPKRQNTAPAAVRESTAPAGDHPATTGVEGNTEGQTQS